MRWVVLVSAMAVVGSLGLVGCDGDDHKNQAPVAMFSASPQAGPTPLSVTLDASASTDKEDRIERYAWVTGDGATLSGITVTHTYERPGEFTVTLTVTDHKGKTSTASQVVTVENRPPVAAFTATPEAGTGVLLVVFDASESSDPDGSIAQYEWQFPGGTSSSGVTVERRFEESGEFEITLRVTDDFGASATVSSSILVEELPVYQMISLGKMGEFDTWAADINERGDVAGGWRRSDCGYPDICTGVFLYRGGEMIDIGTLGGPGTRFGDLNNLGQVTGASQDAARVEHAFLYSDGQMIALPPFDQSLPEDPIGEFWLPPSEGVAINDRGEIAGNATVYTRRITYECTCRAAFHWNEAGEPRRVGGCGLTIHSQVDSNAPFINEVGSILIDQEYNPKSYDIEHRYSMLRADKTIDLGLSYAFDLNDRDSVVGGHYMLGAILYRNGERTELPLLPLALNNRDQVAGVARASDGHDHAFLYEDGSMIDLGTLGGEESQPKDLNDAGEVTGWAQIRGGDGHAFVYSEGRMIDLGTLGGCCSAAAAINSLGQVTGIAEDARGEWLVYLATPIRLLLSRLAEEVRVANVDTVLAQTAEAAKDAYAARDGRQSCSALAEFRTRVTEIGEAVLGAEQAAIWMTKSQEISDALHCS